MLLVYSCSFAHKKELGSVPLIHPPFVLSALSLDPFLSCVELDGDWEVPVLFFLRRILPPFFLPPRSEGPVRDVGYPTSSSIEKVMIPYFSLLLDT